MKSCPVCRRTRRCTMRLTACWAISPLYRMQRHWQPPALWWMRLSVMVRLCRRCCLPKCSRSRAHRRNGLMSVRSCRQMTASAGLNRIPLCCARAVISSLPRVCHRARLSPRDLSAAKPQGAPPRSDAAAVITLRHCWRKRSAASVWISGRMCGDLHHGSAHCPGCLSD